MMGFPDQLIRLRQMYRISREQLAQGLSVPAETVAA